MPTTAPRAWAASSPAAAASSWQGSTWRMTGLRDELLPLQSARAGGTAWEYYYDFGGGKPPWTSSLSQGTGLQSMARAAVKAGRGPELLPQLAKGLAIFQT